MSPFPIAPENNNEKATNTRRNAEKIGAHPVTPQGKHGGQFQPKAAKYKICVKLCKLHKVGSSESGYIMSTVDIFYNHR